MWGSTDINEGGERLLEYLVGNNIEVLNEGSKPTFINAIREEVLDLTLATPFISTYIEKWSVSDEASLSDHRHILFDIPGNLKLTAIVCGNHHHGVESRAAAVDDGTETVEGGGGGAATNANAVHTTANGEGHAGGTDGHQHHHHHHEHEASEDGSGLLLIPAEPEIVRYVNKSLIIKCHSKKSDVKLHWKSPKGEIISEHKGRIHIEQREEHSDELKLVITHITVADKGNWSCEDAQQGKSKKSFDLIVFQGITFTETNTIYTVKEGQNATIYCEVKGEPQPNVTWNFNGQPITSEANSDKFRILADGLLINSVTQNDTGEYTCRAFQVSPIASDMQERTVLMKIEHKPMWTHTEYEKQQYAFMNGTSFLKCEAIAEPPANFSWYRYKKQIHHNDKYFEVEQDPYISILHIKAEDESVFAEYRCKVKNILGSIERMIVLKKGEKPPTPEPLTLRGFNSDKFDIEITHKQTAKSEKMNVNGYRIEYMTELEFKNDLGKWTNAMKMDYGHKIGATFLLSNLKPNTTYLVRAASRNPSGFSDWTKVEKFQTQLPPPSLNNTGASALNVWHVVNIMGFALIALILSNDFIVQPIAQVPSKLVTSFSTSSSPKRL